MKSLWNDADAAKIADDPKAMRIYTSRLLGKNPELVLHGGGNTSLKLTEKDFFGEQVEQIFVKGSGCDLATIEAAEFASLRLEPLQKLAQLPKLSDQDMARQLQVMSLNPDAPNTSVEALLHGLIPLKYVDHTHADSIIAITNTKDGEKRIREIFGDRVLVVPYVMPGFKLAQKVYELTKETNWDDIDGMVLMNHGLVTFDDDAKKSYEATIRLVTQAEEYLESNGANMFAMSPQSTEADVTVLARLRKALTAARGVPVLTKWDNRPAVVGYSSLQNISSVGTMGPTTPDHSIHTKRIPMIMGEEVEDQVTKYVAEYQKYFTANKSSGMECLEPAPRWVIWPGHGTVSVGATYAEASVVSDIAEHTAKVVQQAEGLGGWQALDAKDVFDVEYWELEQAKVTKKKPDLPLQGKIAFVTGAASGIGKACAEQLHEAGAVVIASDINPEVEKIFDLPDFVGEVCDVCDQEKLRQAVESCVARFGGLDIVVSNAGMFAQGCNIESLPNEDWDRSLKLNLTQHKNLMQASYPFLKHGIDPTFVVIGSKNVAAPGPGASAYSVAKAGLNQLMRVAALEWGTDGIRVNVVHPDCVFDTGIWTDEVLEARAKKYEMTVDEYKSRNVLKTPVTSNEVARLVATMSGAIFRKTTGAQIPIDGGNERVI